MSDLDNFKIAIHKATNHVIEGSDMVTLINSHFDPPRQSQLMFIVSTRGNTVRLLVENVLECMGTFSTTTGEEFASSGRPYKGSKRRLKLKSET